MLIIVLEVYIDLDHIVLVPLRNKLMFPRPVNCPEMISKINRVAGIQTDGLVTCFESRGCNDYLFLPNGSVRTMVD